MTLPTSAGEPSKRLAGWSRVTLEAGRGRTVEITLSRAHLADLHLIQYWDPARKTWTTAKGGHPIEGGCSSGGRNPRDTFYLR